MQSHYGLSKAQYTCGLRKAPRCLPTFIALQTVLCLPGSSPPSFACLACHSSIGFLAPAVELEVLWPTDIERVGFRTSEGTGEYQPITGPTSIYAYSIAPYPLR